MYFRTFEFGHRDYSSPNKALRCDNFPVLAPGFCVMTYSAKGTRKQREQGVGGGNLDKF